MRLNERDSQIAIAAVQLLERELADRLEEHPEAQGFDQNAQDTERRVLGDQDRVAQIIRKLATGGEHNLFDWETEIVQASLQRYEAALTDEQRSAMPIADENSLFITNDEQRRIELARTKALLEKFPHRSS